MTKKIECDVSRDKVPKLIEFLEISYPDLQLSWDENEHSLTASTSVPDSVKESITRAIRFFGYKQSQLSNTVIYESGPQITTPIIDVDAELELAGDIVWIGDGLALMRGTFLEVKQALGRQWQKIAEQQFQALEINNPAAWGKDLAIRSRYLDDFHQEALFLVGVKKTSSSLANTDTFFAGLDEGSDLSLNGVFSDLEVVGLVQPSVCTSCYFALSLTSNENSFNQVYTTKNQVFRNEGSKSLSRLLSFEVRDVMAVGQREFVESIRQRLLLCSIEILSKLGLQSTIEVASDPFFATSSSMLAYQNVHALKHELLVYVPQLSKSIAVGSVNAHQQSYGQRFGVKVADESGQQDHMYSCCMGIGIDRLTFTLFSQFGMDTLVWPESTRKFIGLNSDD